MCGIAGRVNFRSGRPASGPAIEAMCELLAHRGPDGEGVFVSGEVGFGHRRLAIIDLSEAGRQPMSTPDGRVTVTFNGEIYNYRELRQALAADGYRFRTRTDTEVILAAWLAHGRAFVDRLRGMFAFALWDARDRTLLLARDRAGKKPLHYRLDADGLAFASEPKAFLAEEAFTPEADPVALSHYLTLQYVPAPLSAFRGIEKLRPGHCLEVRDGTVRTWRYWQLRYAPKLACSAADAVAELEARLDEAVRLRLLSDVPLGAFLSGGIDSGLVVALMARAGDTPVKTFSIGFEDDEYNELPWAREVAERYGTEHHEFVVRPDAVDILPRLVWHYNEPFADSSAVPTFYLSQVTRRHVTVALNGDGGDESFAGYDRYASHLRAGRFDWLPRGPLGPALRRIAARLRRTGRQGGVAARAARLADAAAATPARRYARWLVHFDAGLRDALLTDAFREATAGADAVDFLEGAAGEAGGQDLLDRTLATDVATYLPDDLLVKVDIATMAHGLEARSPLLDHEVMEFAARLPSALKLRGGVKKVLLRRLAADLLPPGVLARPKTGFAVPLARWFRHELRDLAHDVLLGRRVEQRGLVKRSAVERLLREHESGTWNWQFQIWNLLMLEMWYLTFIDARGVPAGHHANPAGMRSAS